VRIDAAIEGCPNCDAESQKKGIDDCVNHADGARNDVSRLKLQRATEDSIAWKDKSDRRLR